MKAIEFEFFFRKCEANNIRIYAMSEYEIQRNLIKEKNNHLDDYNFKRMLLSIDFLKTSKKLRICIETPTERSVGKMFFTEGNVHQQIELLYKLKSEKLCKI